MTLFSNDTTHHNNHKPQTITHHTKHHIIQQTKHFTQHSPMPQAHRTVLTGTDDHRQPGVEAHAADVVAVALQRLQTGLGLVVPDFDGAVVRAGQQVRLVAACEGVVCVLYGETRVFC